MKHISLKASLACLCGLALFGTTLTQAQETIRLPQFSDPEKDHKEPPPKKTGPKQAPRPAPKPAPVKKAPAKPSGPPQHEKDPVKPRGPVTPKGPAKPKPVVKPRSPQPVRRGVPKQATPRPRATPVRNRAPVAKPSPAASRVSGLRNHYQPPVVIAQRRTPGAWNDSGTRHGFVPVRTGWTKSNFSYRHYGVNGGSRYTPSPWYYYSSLPAFLSISFISVNTSSTFAWGDGAPYAYSLHRHHDRISDEGAQLDSCADRISDGFTTRSSGYFDALLPTSQSVTVEMVGQDAYRCSGGDFRELMSDVVNNSETVSYSVVDVWSNGDTATVVAVHTYADQQQQKHWYGLSRYGAGYRIASFRSELM